MSRDELYNRLRASFDNLNATPVSADLVRDELMEVIEVLQVLVDEPLEPEEKEKVEQ